MPRSWPSDEWFLSIMEHHLVSSAQSNPFDSHSFAAYYNEDRCVADTSIGSSDEAGCQWTRVDSDSFTNTPF